MSVSSQPHDPPSPRQQGYNFLLGLRHPSPVWAVKRPTRTTSGSLINDRVGDMSNVGDDTSTKGDAVEVQSKRSRRILRYDEV